MNPQNFINQTPPPPPPPPPSPQIMSFMEFFGRVPHVPNPIHQVGRRSQSSDERLQQLIKDRIETFWFDQMLEINQINPLLVSKQHALPLARIKKVMKLDDNVKMVSADAPVLFSKASELFILELTLRSSLHAQNNMRRIISRSDIAKAINSSDVLEFLHDVVPEAMDNTAQLQTLQNDLVELTNQLNPPVVPQPRRPVTADDFIFYEPPSPL